ncbi:unnamed protein product [Clonostachys rosea f. rosea IK726]|uniref:Uncharacterized protein n=1 Tax=Clonostachys rosea f. rosea IK726 TaxID=1349383 RepID=A0ACA9TQ23_BIOOC|nr:unnamed protein product [Clonostachys rosea f. rosea IK726]
MRIHCCLVPSTAINGPCDSILPPGISLRTIASWDRGCDCDRIPALLELCQRSTHHKPCSGLCCQLKHREPSES